MSCFDVSFGPRAGIAAHRASLPSTTASGGKPNRRRKEKWRAVFRNLCPLPPGRFVRKTDNAPPVRGSGMRGRGLGPTAGSVKSGSGNMAVRAARSSFSCVCQYGRSFEIVEIPWRVRDKNNVASDSSISPPLLADDFIDLKIRSPKVCSPARIRPPCRPTQLQT